MAPIIVVLLGFVSTLTALVALVCGASLATAATIYGGVVLVAMLVLCGSLAVQSFGSSEADASGELVTDR